MNLSQESSILNTQKSPSKHVFKKLLMLVLILAIGATAFVFYTNTKTQEITQFPIYTQNDSFEELPFDKTQLEQGIAVEDVLITYEDLEKKFLLYYPDTAENKANLQNWNEALLKLNHDAILQNEGIKAGLYTKEVSTKIDPIKVNQAKTYFDTQGKNYVSGEIISIWFFNTNIPEIGLENAQQIAQNTIEDLRTRIVNNEITMEQAGEIIKSNTQLEQVDPAYQSNAYRKFSYISPDQSIFNDPELNKKLWDLQVQQVSEVLLGNDFNGNTPYPAYYTIININEKNTGVTYNSAQEMIQQKLLEGLKLNLPQ